MTDIPAFLDRRIPPNKEPEMTATPATTAAEAKTKTRRTDCYQAQIRVQIPLDMGNAESLGGAIKATNDIKSHLPAGSVVTAIRVGMGKL